MNTLRAEITVKLGEKELPCKLNMNAFRLLTQEHGVKLDGIEDFINEDPLTGLATLAHVGCKNAALLNGQEFGWNFDQFCAILLDDMSSIESIGNAFAAAMGGEPGNE